MKPQLQMIQDELKVIRAVLGYTQSEICELLGVSRPHYGELEGKKKKMSKVIAFAIYALMYGKSLTLDPQDLRYQQLKMYLELDAFQELIRQQK